ncbi:dehydrogenase [Streptococcus pneumoniae]|nr:dehydrogenase [Streptococcus pneumoniae]
MPTILITGASGGLAQEMVKLLPNDQLILLVSSMNTGLAGLKPITMMPFMT